jgi:hypothetical protein
VIEAPAEPRTTVSGGWTVRRLVTTPATAALLLLVAYVGLSFLNDSAGTLGTDTGTKVATLREMAEHSTLKPDIGYWAAPWDPDARYHGWLDTRHVGTEYIDTTSLPMLVAAYPFYKVGGYRAALLLPMAGAIAAAFVARAFVRRLRSGSDGWAAFWLVGLASPLLLYALDLWEHTLGVACMAGAALLVYDAVQGRFRWWQGLAAGGLFALAYSMRTEAIVYVITTFGVAGVVLLWRRRVVPAIVLGATGVVAFAAGTLANAGLEIALAGASFRFSRVADTAASAGVGSVDGATRLREAFTTSLSPFPSFDSTFQVLALVLAVALVTLGIIADRRSRRTAAYVALGVAAYVYVDRAMYGPGFWPGLLATTPLAALGLARGWRDTGRRFVLALAVVPLPVVFLTQFPGGALPQWAGRYVLTSGFLLMVVGVASLSELERWARVAFVGLACVTSVFAVAWLSTRTHQVAVSGDALNALPQEVLISPEGFPPREFASTYGVKDWLAMRDPNELPAAVAVVGASGRDSFAIVDSDADRQLPDFPGFHRTGQQKLPYVEPVDFTVTTYARDGT